MADEVLLDARDLVPDDDEGRDCPSCGQPIKLAAIKCRHCREHLGDPACPGVFRSGRQVVMTRFGAFPPRCVKTNQPMDLRLTQNLHCVPLWALWVLLLLGPFFFLAQAFSSANSVRVSLPLSNARMRRRQRGRLLGALIIFGGVAAMVGGLMVDRRAPQNWMGPLIIGGLVMLIAGTVTINFASRLVKVTRTAKQQIWISGVHPDIVAGFPELDG